MAERADSSHPDATTEEPHRHERPEDWGWNGSWGKWARIGGWVSVVVLLPAQRDDVLQHRPGAVALRHGRPCSCCCSSATATAAGTPGATSSRSPPGATSVEVPGATSRCTPAATNVPLGATSSRYSRAASWPQAPSMSRPRVSRTVTGTPWALAAGGRTRARTGGGEASHLQPGVGFSGIRFTCAREPSAVRSS